MVQRALISVSDKTGILTFAQALAARGVEILSTGGTLRALRDGGVEAVSVEDYTGSPEVMGGRVKTLHPRVHGGILARLGGEPDDAGDLDRLGAARIDLVVCNLYPFERTVARGAGYDEAVENIDIGGPSMVRSAAKNHARVTIVTDPEDYAPVLDAIEQGGEVPVAMRRALAAKAFAHTAAYDGAIAAYLSAHEGADAGAGPGEPERFPRYLTVPLVRVATLRYGENPHQAGAWYRERGAAVGSLCCATEVGAGGKELSFNNLVDLDAALEAVREHDRPAAAVIKHTNPCGLAIAETLAEAYRLAREGDPVSAFGGIVALNQRCDAATAAIIAETFIECVVAPGFDDEALARLTKKKALRLVAVGPDRPSSGLTFKRIGGGFVVQDRDRTIQDEVRAGKVVTRRAPTEQELRALEMAWRVCKHVKSNAIVFAHEDRTVGVGAGQMARVTSVQIAAQKAGDLAKGAAMASDAFFPFADGIEAAASAGITAIAQPGGSKKDDEVIAAADAAGIAMIFTGTRHFRH